MKEPVSALVELADRRTSAFARERTEVQPHDDEPMPPNVLGYSPRYASIASLTIGSAVMTYLLSFGFFAGFGCVFLSLATALAPAGITRRAFGCALVSTALAQLTMDIAGPFTWVARFGFIFILLSTGVWYASWRFRDLSG
jgi:hypothetical protein